MRHHPFSRFALATTVALAGLVGCATPNGPVTAPAQAPGVDQGANAETRATLQAEQADERDMEDYGLTADEAAAGGYALMAKGDKPEQAQKGEKADKPEKAEKADKPAKADKPQKADKAVREAFKAALKADVKAKVTARKAEQQAKSKGRRDLHKAEHDMIAKAGKGAAWVDNGDGTQTQTFEADVTRTVNGETMTRHVLMVRTRNADGIVCADHTEFSQALPNGMARSSVRDKALQADGSYKVTYHAEVTFKDGTTRVTDWDKAIAADGGVTGTGTITWTDAAGKVVKAVTIKLGGTEDDEQAEPGSPAPSSAPSAAPSASADPSAAPSADPSAEPSAAPSAEPSAEPTAEPTTTPSAEPTATPAA